MWNGKTVGVVFPAYNEAPNIEVAVREFLGLENSDGSKVVDQVIAIDNNSSDGTGELAAKAGATVFVETKQGYGNALIRGLHEATTDIVVTCEPDGTFVTRDIVKLLSYSEDFDMVCGTRTYPGLVWEDANMRWYLRLGNYFVAKFLEIMYWTPSLSDCGCTFRMINLVALKKIRGQLYVGKSHFLPHMVITAKINQISFIEIPVTYRGRKGESKITGSFSGMFKTGFAMIGIILAMWPRFISRRG
tara:strand:- start:5381 stop:6118 length:738 start_codon:yes stop_codon:yes gene_type:complete